MSSRSSNRASHSRPLGSPAVHCREASLRPETLLHAVNHKRIYSSERDWLPIMTLRLRFDYPRISREKAIWKAMLLPIGVIFVTVACIS